MRNSAQQTMRVCSRELTLNDGKKDNDHKEEESDIKEDAVSLVGVSVGWLDLVTYATSSSDSHIEMVDIALSEISLRGIRHGRDGVGGARVVCTVSISWHL